ncbi:MAG TPA: TRAM domain-containing protein [Mycobacteriales bacterium]|nr:TRAM domain-containing protein [Mycobacteriales bacterium]
MTVGAVLELEIGPVGHGGICVAHAADGRAVLVRHALPGEKVRAVVTEQKSSYLRADAVEVMTASPHRVVPPCEFAGPGRCGGCDWQHVELSEQRALKAEVVAGALRRTAKLEREVVVEPVPGDRDGLGWRTRMRLAVGPDGGAGLHRHRSTEIEHITHCLIAHESLPVASVLEQTWPDVEAVDLQASDEEVAGGRRYRIPEGGFWQVHPGAPDALIDAVLGFLDVRPSDRCLDLYGGVGLFAGALAPLAPRGHVVLVESHRAAAAAAVANLADLSNVEVVADDVARWLRRGRARADVVVLDPPRKGAGAPVVEAISAMQPRQVCYVACEPASLARDIATFEASGWSLTGLRAFDLFPMTAHVECVALLEPAT